MAYLNGNKVFLYGERTVDANLTTKTIKQNGTYNASSDNADGYSSVTVDVAPPVVDEDTMYLAQVINYDGTVLKEQWLNDGDTFELPIPPEHPRVVFDNDWCATQPVTKTTIDGVDHYTIVINKNDFQASPLYTTKSGALELEIELNLFTGLTVTINSFSGANSNTNYIDWGDGSPQELSVNNLSHTYESYGTYIVKYILINRTYPSYPVLNSNFKVAVKKVYIDGLSNYSISLTLYDCRFLEEIWFGKGNAYHPYDYNGSLMKVCIIYSPTGTSFSSSSGPALYRCKYVIINHQYTSSGSNALGMNNMSVLHIAFPIGLTYWGEISSNKITRLVIPPSLTSKGSRSFSFLLKMNTSQITTLNNYTYAQFYSLKEIKLPSNAIAIPNGCCQDCYSLQRIEIPSGVTSVGSYAFQNCSKCQFFDFTECTSVPTLANTNAFNGTNANSKILVPPTLYDTWKTASNWVNYASRIVPVDNT